MKAYLANMNSEKPLSPKMLTALKNMGSDRMIEDLRGKYRLPQVTQEPEDAQKTAQLVGMGSDSAIADLRRRRVEQEQRVAGLPVVYETYSEKELTQISQVRQQLDMMTARFNVRVAGFKKDSPQYAKEAQQEIAKMVAYLDNLPLWKYKFSTEVGASVRGPLKEDDEDSIYYMTAHGISMRLRRASIADGYGLDVVAQPFMEKIRFCDVRANRFESEPTLGLTVEDYASREFEERVKDPESKGDLVSPLAVYMKDGKPIAVGGPEDVRRHNGDRVNKIFTSR